MSFLFRHSIPPRPSQIISCFEKISCFGLTHPGFDVVKKTFSGDIAKIQPSFLRLLNTYVRHIFGEQARPRPRGSLGANAGGLSGTGHRAGKK